MEADQVDNSQVSNSNWGVLQVTNSTNFSLDSPFWLHVSGGLNYQIEHHLLPSYNHMVLPWVSKIVQDTCKEFGIR
jgi:fatty acid desaturase